MKKLVSLLLSLTMLAVLAAPVAANTTAIHGEVYRILDLAFYNYEENGSINPERTVPGDEIIIPLVWAGFEDEQGVKVDWDGANDLGPTVSQTKQNRIYPRLLFTAGKEVIRDVEIVPYTPTRRVRARSAIRVRFVDHLVSTQEITYNFRVALELNDTVTYVRETFGGMISNRQMDITPVEIANLDYVDLFGDVVLNCVQSADNVVANLENGVFAHLDMVTGGKFYGYSEMDHTDKQDKDYRVSDDPVVQAYDQIKYAYSITSINVKNMLKHMKITVPGDVNYYVYNEYGEYVGRSDDNLPYSTRYYLATESIDIDPEIVGKSYTTSTKDMGPELKRFLNIA